MLGNSLLRNPRTRENTFDKGILCESLLFFGSTHLLIDFATLAHVIRAEFLDDLIEMLKRGHLTANFTPEMCGVYNQTDAGLKRHRYVVFRMGGDQKTGPLNRNADVLEFQLRRDLGDRGKATRYFKQLADLISFKGIGDDGISSIAREDITDPAFAGQVARLALLNKGVPADEVGIPRIDVLKLSDNMFALSTDIDLKRLERFLPADAGLTEDALLSGVMEARADLHLAARLNAALVGNEDNQTIVDMILRKSMGAGLRKSEAAREIYDTISVSTPSVREVINSGERSVAEFTKLMESAAVFRKWLNEQNPNADLVREMLREKGEVGWLESLPAKLARFALFTGGGKLADLFVPGTSVMTEGIDALVLEQLAKRWRPHYFVESNLKGFLDKVE
jgi:hypothetical protein